MKTKQKPKRRTIPIKLQARYDAAQTTRDNARHWAMADGLSADAAASPEVRKKLRQRARYEIANNSYAKGIILTLANDAIGTGPRLQILTRDGQLNKRIEDSFNKWVTDVNLASKLRAMRMAKCGDGEVFAILVNNPNIQGAVKLDIKLIEADRVVAPFGRLGVRPEAKGQRDVDGIRFDSYGNPAGYYVLKDHPGDLTSFLNDYDYLPADSVIHWFRADRPGQHRGVPEMTPALGLFAQLRRYTLAVIAAAESAADFAAVLYTDAPANGEAATLRRWISSSLKNVWQRFCQMAGSSARLKQSSHVPAMQILSVKSLTK